MAISIVDLGKNIVATKRTLTATTDNALNVRCKMTVKDSSSTVVYEAINEPDLGTSNEFTFEINTFLFRQFYNTQFPLSTNAINERFDLKVMKFIFQGVAADGTIGAAEFIATTSIDSLIKNFTFTHNITQRFNKINSFDVTDYYCDDNGNTTKKFLTSAPTSSDIWINDKNYLSVLKWSTTIGAEKQCFVIEEYNYSDALYMLTKTPFEDRLDFADRIPFHNTMEINITSAATKYALCYVEDITGTIKRSEIKRYNVVNNCGYIKLEWINEFGKVDYFYFKGEQIKNLQTISKTYEKATPVNPTANDYGTRVYDNEMGENWTLYTDTISQSTVEFLSNMFLAKKVSLDIEGNRFPAVLNTNKLNYYKDINGIYQISINITFSNNVLGIN
tara:strand:- start:2428 stop:3597 length:1170 start_codon:yes stop_codon:yes gene_type:complete